MAADEGSGGDGPMPKIDLYGYGTNVDLRCVHFARVCCDIRADVCMDDLAYVRQTCMRRPPHTHPPTTPQPPNRTVAPLYGVTNEEEPDYLDYDIKGRGTVEKMFLYSGSAYLTGILSGGVLGGRTGWKSAPSPRFWIRVNSVMNGAGKYGSKWGNNMGVIGA